MEDFPEELGETIKMFHASLAELSNGFDPLLATPRSDLYERLEPLERLEALFQKKTKIKSNILKVVLFR